MSGWEGGWPWWLVLCIACAGVIGALVILARAYRWMGADIQNRRTAATRRAMHEAVASGRMKMYVVPDSTGSLSRADMMRRVAELMDEEQGQ
jgi:hypothetical protein